MSALQSTIFIEFDANTKKITFLRGDNVIDYDSNTTSIYARVKYKNLSGNTVYLTPSELEDYKFSLYTIKPMTNNVTEITGKVTDELKENVYGGVVKFEIPRVCTNRSGIVKCEIHIEQENKRIGSSNFVLDVKQSLVTAFDDELLEDEDFPVLKQLIREVQEINKIDDTSVSANTIYSSNKIEIIKENLSSQIREIREVDLSGYVTKETGNANQITFTDGETFQAKLDTGILKGEKGDIGERGEKGDKGDTGANGQDGLTTNIVVNGNTYSHSNGTITLPNYPTVVSSADGITIQDTAGNFTATNVEGALAELFQFVSNGKTLIASAITDMGVDTSNTDSFEVMANKIRTIIGKNNSNE